MPDLLRLAELEKTREQEKARDMERDSDLCLCIKKEVHCDRKLGFREKNLYLLYFQPY